MAQSAITINMDKLNDENNYADWSNIMKLVLQVEDLLSVIENEPPHHDDAWAKKDERARELMSLSVDANYMGCVMSSKTATEAWAAIRQCYLSKLPSKMVLYRKVYRTSLEKDDSDMEKHIDEMTKNIDTLEVVQGAVISNEEKVKILLASLLESYDEFVESFTDLPKKSLTFEWAKEKLIIEYRRRVCPPQCNRQINDNASRDIICAYCKKLGHRQKECPGYELIQKELYDYMTNS